MKKLKVTVTGEGEDYPYSGSTPTATKIQVFVLENNAAVRSRLTHSMEVHQVGRYIAKHVRKSISEQDLTEQYGLNDKCDGFVSALEIVSLWHEVNSPPFAHLGEEAINAWTKEFLCLFL